MSLVSNVMLFQFCNTSMDLEFRALLSCTCKDGMEVVKSVGVIQPHIRQNHHAVCLSLLLCLLHCHPICSLQVVLAKHLQALLDHQRVLRQIRQQSSKMLAALNAECLQFLQSLVQSACSSQTECLQLPMQECVPCANQHKARYRGTMYNFRYAMHRLSIQQQTVQCCPHQLCKYCTACNACLRPMQEVGHVTVLRLCWALGAKYFQHGVLEYGKFTYILWLFRICVPFILL